MAETARVTLLRGTGSDKLLTAAEAGLLAPEMAAEVERMRLNERLLRARLTEAERRIEATAAVARETRAARAAAYAAAVRPNHAARETRAYNAAIAVAGFGLGAAVMALIATCVALGV